MYFNISITIIMPNISSFHHFYLNFHLFHHFSPFYLSYFSHGSHPNYFLDDTSYIFPFSHLTKPYTILTFLILIVLFITFLSTSSLLNLLARPIRLIHPSPHPFIHHKVLIHLIRLILSFWSILSIRSTRPSSRLYSFINLKILILLICPTPLNLLIILIDHILPIRPTPLNLLILLIDLILPIRPTSLNLPIILIDHILPIRPTSLNPSVPR